MTISLQRPSGSNVGKGLHEPCLPSRPGHRGDGDRVQQCGMVLSAKR